MNPYQHLLATIRKTVAGAPYRFTYAADGFGVRKKFVPFADDPAFEAAWQETKRHNDPFWDGKTPDIRWRAHVCAWAASNCLRLEGDFAEFGVNTGILSSMILKTTDFAASDKSFYLFDTFGGIPTELATEAEMAHTKAMNETIYAGDVLSEAKRAFAPFDNIEFVIGMLPGTLTDCGMDKIAYASIDLNSMIAEMAVAERIWDKITPGGMIVLDDYGFGGHEEQNQAWNDFAKSKDRMILAMPTGQGILMR